MSDDRQYLPFVADDLPGGARPMMALLHAVHGHENALTDAVATLAAAVRAELAQHSTADASALTQLVEVEWPLATTGLMGIEGARASHAPIGRIGTGRYSVGHSLTERNGSSSDNRVCRRAP